ncbi:MAG: sterol desaturase family protein [Woeseiaceae bacterium]|nr:sterol desaturase family protein [Woeseiaceae bacterium]
MEILIFISVAVASYYLMSIVQTVLHRDFGHRKRIDAVFSAHAIGHHGQYNKHKLQSETFVELESHALNYYGIPIVVIAVLVYLLAGPLVMTAHLLGVFATFRWHIYLHEHYHLINSPFERFAWFREKRRLHFIHHIDARYNFAVVEFWIDRLMGTRKEA